MPLRIAKSGAAIATFRIIDIDNDAFTFLTAAGITNTTQRNAINKLVIDLKYYGIWTKQRAIYPVVGGVAASHAVNLKTPGTYNLSFTGGWVHSANGMLPNGSSDYADTGLVPSSALTLNSTHLSYYSRTNINSDVYTMVSVTADDANIVALYANYLGTMYSSMYNGVNGRVTGAVSRGDGFFIGSRTSTSSHKIYRNSTLINTSTTSTSLGSLPNVNMLIGQYRVGITSGLSAKQCAFASIGDGLTDTDALNFYNIVQRYQTNLSRQV